MSPQGRVAAPAILISVAALSFAWQAITALAEEPQSPRSEKSRVTVDAARDRAILLQNTYVATLHVMHERYFHDERAIVPARALEDVFAELERQSQVKARWISVNTKPMSVGHQPKSDFEKRAASEIADGKEAVENIEAGLYQRAVAIPLASGCVSCHTGFFGGNPKSPRYAALVVSMPVANE